MNKLATLTTIPLLLLACGGQAAHEEPEPTPPTFEYAYTITHLDTDDCLDLVSTCEDVALLCNSAADLTPACRDVARQDTDVYALPGAAEAPGRPFGVSSCVELVPCGTVAP